jgi:hypothetical protein
VEWLKVKALCSKKRTKNFGNCPLFGDTGEVGIKENNGGQL